MDTVVARIADAGINAVCTFIVTTDDVTGLVTDMLVTNTFPYPVIARLTDTRDGQTFERTCPANGSIGLSNQQQNALRNKSLRGLTGHGVARGLTVPQLASRASFLLLPQETT